MSGVKIMFLTPKKLADGRTKYHWKASPRLRRNGWTNLDCGTDRAQAIALAEARNEEVAKWERGLLSPDSHDGAVFANAPKARTMGELIDDYLRSDSFTSKKPKTRASYQVQLRKIRQWTSGGKIPVAHIDRQAVLDLRKTLMQSGSSASKANFLRQLRIVMQYAVDEGILSINPAAKIKIPQTPMRRHIINGAAVELLTDTARVLGFESIALSMVLGFWTMQREDDLLAYQERHWKALPTHDVPHSAIASLADAHGQIWALERDQDKTGEWVAAPLPRAEREMVENKLAANRAKRVASLNILCDDTAPRRYPQRLFQKRFAKVRSWAWWRAMQNKDWRLAKHIRSSRFADFRRTGMCHYAMLGVPIPLIASISGHSIDYTQKILDTYMPHNRNFAIMGVATAIERAAINNNAVKERELR